MEDSTVIKLNIRKMYVPCMLIHGVHFAIESTVSLKQYIV